MKLMWGENLFFKKSGAKAGRFSFFRQITFLRHQKRNPLNPYIPTGFGFNPITFKRRQTIYGICPKYTSHSQSFNPFDCLFSISMKCRRGKSKKNIDNRNRHTIISINEKPNSNLFFLLHKSIVPSFCLSHLSTWYKLHCLPNMCNTQFHLYSFLLFAFLHFHTYI